MKKHFTFLLLIGLSFPVLALAQVSSVFDLETLILMYVNALARLFFVVAVAFFIWGVVLFIKNSNDTAEHEKGKKFIIWGIIAFVVIVSVWGIVRLLLVDTLGFTPGGVPVFRDKSGAPV